MITMKKYLLDLLIFLCLGISLTLNFYLLEKYNNQLQYKKRVLELIEKRNNTVSLAKESLYTDSINNTVNDWLKDDTNK
jgi:hypothetical protein